MIRVVLPGPADLPAAARRVVGAPAAVGRMLGIRTPFSGPARPVVRTGPGRVYLGVRGVHEPGRERLAEAMEKALEAVEGVHWAAVNPVLAHVVVAFDGDSVNVEDLAGIVESVEDAEGEPDDDFPPGAADHPADPTPLQRTALGLVADAAGIGIGIATAALRLPRLPVEAASAVPAVDSLRPVRDLLDRRPGMETASAIVNGALQGLGQGPVGLMVDAAHRVAILGELAARRRAWLSAEPRLHPARPAGRPQAPEREERPQPAPAGLVDRYGQAASFTALGAAGVTLAATGDPRRSADMLLAGLPRAARLGLDGFASQLGRTLADRRVVPMDPRVLRRLDSIDTVVIDAEAVHAGACPPGTAAQIAAAARRAGCRLVLAGGPGPEMVASGMETAAGGRHLARTVRTLQGDGRTVALVSARTGTALRAADCGIGVLDPAARHPPWGAHLLCLEATAVPGVIDAVRYARTASRQAAGCAAAGSAVAGFLAAPAVPGAGRRAVTAVQSSALAALLAGTWTATQLPAPVPPAPEAVAWHSIETREVLARLGSGQAGITNGEADTRWRPPEQPAGPGLTGLLAAELTNPLSLILGAGAALSAVTGSVLDATLISCVLGIDALIGVAQRSRTEAIINRLSSAINATGVRVMRDGSEITAAGDSLVTGDVIHVAAGDSVPADCRVIESVGMEADESALTGESLPVPKTAEPVPAGAAVGDRASMIYAGTAVAAGRGSAVVVATGGETEARQGVPAGPPPPTGVQNRLKALTDLTVPVVLASGAGLALNSLLRGRPLQEAISSGVSLAAAAVPEGLPFVATVAQAGAAHRLAGRGVLVRNPGVLEALGRVDVLCFDKTGTLTEGRLRLRLVSDGRTDEPADRLSEAGREILAAALRAAPRPRGREMAHPTNQAIVDGAAAARIRHSHGAPHWQKTASLPFEPGRAYHAVLGRTEHGPLLSVKGAPEVVLPRCVTWRRQGGPPVPLDAGELAGVRSGVERLAQQGLRVLAVAERAASGRAELHEDRIDRLELLGLVGVADSARPTASAPLQQLTRSGINCVMVTGDHPSTAEAIATDLGLLDGRRVASGPELDGLDDAQLDDLVGEVAVFARVTPAHKVRIVRAFQRTGRVVAMTGDGANDAQAIRMAQIGVAFGPKATPAARDAADLVVVPGDLNVLIDTIVEGRAMWASVREALALLLGGNLGEVAFTTGAALIAGRPPLTARQLLAVNLFTDLVPAMALAVSPPRTGRIELAREGPETSLAGQLARDVVIRASATAGGTFAAWGVARLTGTETRARTIALAALIGTELGQTLAAGIRSPLVVASSLVSTAGLVAVIQTPGISGFFDCRPLGPVGWTTVAASSAAASAAAFVAQWAYR